MGHFNGFSITSSGSSNDGAAYRGIIEELGESGNAEEAESVGICRSTCLDDAKMLPAPSVNEKSQRAIKIWCLQWPMDSDSSSGVSDTTSSTRT